MSLEQKVNDELRVAMKARDKVKLDTLRGIKKEIIEAKTAKGATSELSEDTEMKILQKMLKQRQDSAEIYEGQNRNDLAEDERNQAEIISGFLPKQLSHEELETEIVKLMGELGVDSMAGMGRVMGEATKRFAGKADGKTISGIVKDKLSK
ncbi:GatB/YqeY domain-containing protein [Saccharicrinis sp. FJH54]|uniref:GatB/YqeY domain-containing protein n=1 Tax=Saccharicrinis sp. FJH54 TaxID=3344665 RepID=UPI0035D4BE73